MWLWGEDNQERGLERCISVRVSRGESGVTILLSVARKEDESVKHRAGFCLRVPRKGTGQVQG